MEEADAREGLGSLMVEKVWLLIKVLFITCDDACCPSFTISREEGILTGLLATLEF